ncbi:MAG: acyltransferase family protein [Sedimentisphaerales bacterium]|nr:acyltransferase family protein [Sedimentisphaerales bacterium]
MEKTRLYFIDNLRILLITLVIMQHLSITYGGEGSWYYKEGRGDEISAIVLTVHNAVNQSFFMGFLFLISGYFTPVSYDRKGPRRFLKDRLLRLGIPILCYDFIIGPLIVRPMIWFGVQNSSGSYFDYLLRYYSSFHVGTGPLWFSEALLIFAGFYILRRRLAKAAAPDSPEDSKIPDKVTIAAFALALGVITFVVRIWLPIGWAFGPLNLQFPFFPQYIGMFIVGIIAYHRNWLIRIPDAMGRFWLCIAVFFIIVLFPVLFVLGGAPANVPLFMGGLHWQCFAYAAWEQFTCVAIIISLLFLFRKWFNRQSKLSKAMSASSYTTYIIHTPLVILVAIAIRNIELYPLLKFALTVLISVPLCFSLGNFIRQLPPAKRIL